ncbi:MAG: hypothetical protein C4294_17185, partial [Nitrospiraceae bacterium]
MLYDLQVFFMNILEKSLLPIFLPKLLNTQLTNLFLMKVKVLLSISISAILIGFILTSTISLGNANASSTQGVPKNGLVAEWKFENNVKDTSENHHNGVITGDPDFLKGKVGRSLSFDGNYEVVTVASSPA